MTPSAEGLPNVANGAGIGAALREARRACGLSLGALARLTHYSKSYLARVETGQRHATAEVLHAYDQALIAGDDNVQRRHLLRSLLATAIAPTAISPELVAQAIEAALDVPRLSVEDWLAKVDAYERDYTLTGTAETQARLAADLALLRYGLDQPQLCAAAARLVTLHGHGAPSALSEDGDVKLRLYLLAARTADRSGDRATRVWTRGRAALALAYSSSPVSRANDRAAARALATQALAIDNRPTLGSLNALLGQALVQAYDGDRPGATASYGDAHRVLDAIGPGNDELADAAMPEWRFAMLGSLLFSWLGAEQEATKAHEEADRARPNSLARFAPHIELHRALARVQAGDVYGLTGAYDTVERLPPAQRSLSLRLMLANIEQAARPHEMGSAQPVT